MAIRKECLPKDHHHLATSYQNIGLVCLRFGYYQEALENFQRTLEIREKSLPANHYEMGDVYTNLGSVYYEMKEYSQAKDCFETALRIYQKNNFSDNHHKVVTVKKNIEHANKALAEIKNQQY